jgi:hypothetical protein
MVIRFVLAAMLCGSAFIGQSHAQKGKKPVEINNRLVCAGPLCARLTHLPGGGMGTQITTFPARTTHVNMRCPNGLQQDSRRSTYLFCRDRSISLQHCRKGTFSSTCSPWFIFTMRGAEYQPR